ncbi:MAG: DNA polymerase III subunit epsilon [Pseudomonadota bacterium]
MREIALDTETTGLEALGGDRVVEIGCVELINHVATSNGFHVYLDPGRPMSPEASAITGITDDMLRGKPKFEAVADDFLRFVDGAPLVIHNASFDMGFLNMELGRAKRPPLPLDKVVDTLKIARKRFPGSQANLDALCRRFNIDNSAREKHGALLDAELLAEVYLELRGGRQPGFALAARGAVEGDDPAAQQRVEAWRPRRSRISEGERAAHRALIAEMGDAAIWIKAPGWTD